MRAQWNPPLVEVDAASANAVDGKLYQGIRLTFCVEDIEMFRQGYKCIGPMDAPGMCGEPQPHAFPDECLLCGFPMKREQARVFDHLYAGWRDAPKGQIDEQAELERLARQRHERETREGLRHKGIVIPKGVSLS